MTGRDGLGRFTAGNTIARLGWAGLVARRFGGDEATARAWVGRVGVWAYAKQFVGNQTPAMAIRFATCYAYPGAPEQFAAEYQRRFEFSLADVPEMEY